MNLYSRDGLVVGGTVSNTYWIEVSTDMQDIPHVYGYFCSELVQVTYQSTRMVVGYRDLSHNLNTVLKKAQASSEKIYQARVPFSLLRELKEKNLVRESK